MKNNHKPNFLKKAESRSKTSQKRCRASPGVREEEVYQLLVQRPGLTASHIAEALNEAGSYPAATEKAVRGALHGLGSRVYTRGKTENLAGNTAACWWPKNGAPDKTHPCGGCQERIEQLEKQLADALTAYRRMRMALSRIKIITKYAPGDSA